MRKLSSAAVLKPTTERMVSSTVQVFSISFTDLQAAAVLCGPEDIGPPLEPSAVSRMLAADHRTWAAAVIREGQVIG